MSRFNDRRIDSAECAIFLSPPYRRNAQPERGWHDADRLVIPTQDPQQLNSLRLPYRVVDIRIPFVLTKDGQNQFHLFEG
jgi:hypothetical protein